MNSRRQQTPTWRDPTVVMAICCVLYGIAWGVLFTAFVAMFLGVI